MTIDYRDSHLTKGADYDENLSLGDFDTYMTLRERELVTSIARRFFPQGISRSLDFACGTGRMTQHLESLAKESYGVDVSPAMLDVARRKCRRTTFLHADLTTTPLGLPPFDLVTAFRFFGNAQSELRAAALDAIRRTLAPGGLLILNDHVNPRSLHRRLQQLRGEKLDRGVAPRELHALLRANGFDVVRTYGIGLWLLRYKWDVPSAMHSRVVRAVEPLSRVPGLAMLSPDVVIVARRR